ncbi:MAG: hypothetical protein V3R24_01105 [Gemmatimonadales bacterium]
MKRTALYVLALTALIPKQTLAQQPDFSTPEVAVQNFLEAVANGDADLLAECFAEDAEGEFTPIREKQLADSDWAELQELFRDAEIIETVMAEDESTATVRVQLRQRSEALYMTMEGSAWKIRGF